MNVTYIHSNQSKVSVCAKGKLISNHEFVPYAANEDFETVSACAKCCFDTIGCKGLPCTSDDRKDKRNGYFATLE